MNIQITIEKHPIQRSISELLEELHKLPSSDLKTRLILLASNLKPPVSKVLTALADSLSVYPCASPPVRVTGERIETWLNALEGSLENPPDIKQFIK